MVDGHACASCGESAWEGGECVVCSWMDKAGTLALEIDAATKRAETAERELKTGTQLHREERAAWNSKMLEVEREIERLVAGEPAESNEERDELRAALRQVAIGETGVKVASYTQVACCVCKVAWADGHPERHADDCLARERES